MKLNRKEHCKYPPHFPSLGINLKGLLMRNFVIPKVEENTEVKKVTNRRTPLLSSLVIWDNLSGRRIAMRDIMMWT